MSWFFKNKSYEPSYSQNIVDASNKINAQSQGTMGILKELAGLDLSHNEALGLMLELTAMYMGIHATRETSFYSRRGIDSSDQKKVVDYFLMKSMAQEPMATHIKNQASYYQYIPVEFPNVSKMDQIISEAQDRITYFIKNGKNLPFGLKTSKIPLDLDIFSPTFVISMKFRDSVLKGIELIP